MLLIAVFHKFYHSSMNPRIRDNLVSRKLITGRFFWPGMKRGMRDWVDSCNQSLRMNGTPPKHTHSLTTWQSSQHFRQVSLEEMGPLPVSEVWKFVRITGDQFSKWYEAVGMPKQKAQSVARALVEMCSNRFDCPVNFHSDKGTNFISELFREFCWFVVTERTSKTTFHL